LPRSVVLWSCYNRKRGGGRCGQCDQRQHHPILANLPNHRHRLLTRGSCPNEILMGKVLHASKSGYFISCIQNGAGYWSLDRAMEIYWRVKKWELSVTVTYTIFGEDAASQTVTTYPGYPGPFQPVIINSLTSQGQEEYLVCEHYLNSDYTSGPTDIFFFQPNKSGSLYDPGFFLLSSWDFEDDLGAMSCDVFNGSGGGEVRPFSIYGSSPIPISFSYPGRPDASFSFDNATFSLEPKEWFSYDGTYNTSTGARL